MDDITMSSFSNSGATPNKSNKRGGDSITKKDDLIVGWSKSNVKIGANGNIFP